MGSFTNGDDSQSIMKEGTLEEAYLVLNGLPHVGPITAQHLFEALGEDPLKILSASRGQLQRVEKISKKAIDTLLNWEFYFDLNREKKYLEQYCAHFYAVKHTAYPEKLRHTYDPPIGLYVLGEGLESQQSQPKVAIIGTRNASHYGKKVAFEIARDLADAGIVVVSGMARGIDTAAHQGALAGGGITYAVLGCGLDTIYPAENKALYEKIKERGILFSEFCFGRKPDRQTFPMRNRIVSGIADAVVVVESQTKGGSMITARFAMEQNRQVFAVPGRIDDDRFGGCHALIRDGAVLLSKVEDITAELSYGNQGLALSSKPKEIPQPHLSGNESVLWECICEEKEIASHELFERVALDPVAGSVALSMLEIQGLVVRSGHGRYSINH